MATTETLIMRIIADNKDLREKIDDTNKQIRKVAKTTKSTSTKSTSFLKQMRAGWLAAAAAVGVAVRALVTFGKETIKAASEFEEADSKFRTVFRGVTTEANAMRDDLVKNFATSSVEATRFLSSIQDMLVPMGLARGEAANMAGQIVRLSADLGSFNDMPTETVMQGIQSALAGQIEPMRRYGVFLTQNRIKQEAMNLGLVKADEELTQVAKSQAILSIITKDSADAIGDMARTSDDFANTMKQIGAFTADVKVAIGQELVKALAPALKGFKDFIAEGKGIEKVRAAIAGTIAAVKLLGDAYQALLSVARTIFELMNTLLFQPLKEQFIALGKTIKLALTGDFDGIKKVWADAAKSLGKNFQETIKERLDIHKKQFAEITAGIDAIANAGEQKRRDGADATADALIAAKEREAAEKKRIEEEAAAAKAEADAAAKVAEDLRQEQRIAAQEQFTAIAKQAINSINSLQQAKAKEQIKRADRVRDREIAALQQQLDAGTISEEQFQAGKIAANKKAEREIFKAKRKAFFADKKTKIAQIVINTALAVMTAFGQLGPVGGLVAAAALAILSGVQVAAVNAQSPPSPPAFQAGGIAGRSGPEVIQVGEAGAELVVPAQLTAQLAALAASGDGGDTINVQDINISGQADPEGSGEAVRDVLGDLSSDLGRSSILRAT